MSNLTITLEGIKDSKNKLHSSLFSNNNLKLPLIDTQIILR
jgi:hypothetical protein